MDPVSVFTALYDTKCISFSAPNNRENAQPYQIDLRRLSLHPKLLNAVVSQVTEKYLTPHSLQANTSRKTSSSSSPGKPEGGLSKNLSASEDSDADSHFDEELETSCGDDFDWDNIDDQSEPIICSATDSGSVPLTAAIAFKADLPHLSYDDQETFSVGNGNTELKKRVILIEDMITSGDKTLDTIKKIEESQKFKVQFVVCVVDCDFNGIDRLEHVGVRVMSLYNLGAILRILEITGRITTDQYSQTRQWIAKSQQLISQTPIVQQQLNKCPIAAITVNVPKSNIELVAR